MQLVYNSASRQLQIRYSDHHPHYHSQHQHQHQHTNPYHASIINMSCERLSLRYICGHLADVVFIKHAPRCPHWPMGSFDGLRPATDAGQPMLCPSVTERQRRTAGYCHNSDQCRVVAFAARGWRCCNCAYTNSGLHTDCGGENCDHNSCASCLLKTSTAIPQV